MENLNENDPDYTMEYLWITFKHFINNFYKKHKIISNISQISDILNQFKK